MRLNLDAASVIGRAGKVFQMIDLGCIAAGVAFFLIAIAYTAGCDRLGAKEGQ